MTGPAIRNTENGQLCCLWCRTQTSYATLAQYGARCFRCFEDYCREPQGEAKAQPPKARNVMLDFGDDSLDAGRIAQAKADAQRKVDQRMGARA